MSLKSLISYLSATRSIKSAEIEQTMLCVERALFTQRDPYDDSPQPIGYGATISAPHMHATALEYMLPILKESTEEKRSLGIKALDVGSGSGYLTACIAKLISLLYPERDTQNKSIIVGLEIISELVAKSKSNIEAWKASEGFHGIHTPIIIKEGNGWEGDPQNGPYDIIHVGAAAEETPQSLVEQLKPGGVLLVPIGSSAFYQNFTKISKDKNGRVKSTSIVPVAYVPLVRSRDDI